VQEFANVRLFIEVVRCGSFSAAARAFKLSTSAVSRRIAKLEGELRVRLLVRTTRTLQPTDAGRAYYEASCSALDRLAEAADAVMAQEARVSGTVRIAVPGLWSRTHLLPYLADFLDAHPQLHLELTFCDLLPDLAAAGLDIGIQHSEPTSTDYVARCIDLARVHLVASPGYLKKRGVPTHPAELVGHDCINLQLATGPVTWRIIGEGGSEYVHVPRGRLFLMGHYDSILEAAANDLGITVAEVSSSLPLLQSGRLQVVLPEYRVAGTEPGALRVMMLYPHRRYVPLRVRCVMDFIASVAQRSMDAPFNPYAFAGGSTAQHVSSGALAAARP
jgi:DNA-binding transcriptional LysR family regulator